MRDMIDRRAVMTIVREYLENPTYTRKMLLDDLKNLPSVQSEKLTDAEQRIFLTAMGREEKVCKEIDEKNPNEEPYEDSLVYVCKEIERKVKGALWT